MTIKKDYSQQNEILALLHRICDTFHDAIPANIYRDLVLCLLFLKYLSDYHKERLQHYETLYPKRAKLVKELMSNERFLIPENCSFSMLYEQRHDFGNGQRLDIVLHKLQTENSQLNQVFDNVSFDNDAFVSQLQKNNTLRRALDLFGKKVFKFDAKISSGPYLAKAYITLLDHFSSLSSFKKSSAFYSPVEVSQLVINILAPQPGDTIYDPACGSGGLLLQCGRYIHKHFPDQPYYTLFGQEKNQRTWALAKMNLYIHEEDQHRIECSDSLRSPLFIDKPGKLQKFDIGLCIPSFTSENWGADTAEHDIYQRFIRGVPPKNKSEYAFICHMLNSLKAKGKLAILVPHGVLFRAGVEGKIRQQLVDEKWIEAVIGLPEKLLYDTSIATVLLIFNRQGAEQGIFFIDASRDFKEYKAQNQLAPGHIEKIQKCYTQRDNIDNYAYLASYEEIRSKQYNLHIPLYIHHKEKESKLDLDSVIQERESIQSRLSDLESDIAQKLKELVHGQ